MPSSLTSSNFPLYVLGLFALTWTLSAQESHAFHSPRRIVSRLSTIISDITMPLPSRSQRPAGRYSFVIKLVPNGPDFPVTLDFYHYKPITKFPVHLQFFDNRITIRDPEAPALAAYVEYAHKDPIRLFRRNRGAGLALQPYLSDLIYWFFVISSLVCFAAIAITGFPSIQAPIGLRTASPQPVPVYDQVSIDLRESRIVNVWGHTKSALNGFASGSSRIILNPAGQVGAAIDNTYTLDILSFFSSLSEALAELQVYQEELQLWVSSVRGRKAVQSGASDAETEATIKATIEGFETDYDEIPEITRRFVDLWYHLAARLPDDLDTVVRVLENLEPKVEGSENASEVIQHILLAFPQKRAMSLDNIVQEQEEILLEMDLTLATIDRAIELPLAAIALLDLEHPAHLRLAKDHSETEIHKIASVHQILSKFTKINARPILRELRLNIGSGIGHISWTSIMLGNMNRLAVSMSGRDVRFVDSIHDICATKYCIPPAKAIASEIHEWAAKLEETSQSNTKHWAAWQRRMESKATGGQAGPRLVMRRPLANPAPSRVRRWLRWLHNLRLA